MTRFHRIGKEHSGGVKVIGRIIKFQVVSQTLLNRWKLSIGHSCPTICNALFVSGHRNESGNDQRH